MTKLTPTKVKEAIKDSFGIKSQIAQRCNCTRSAITQFFHKNPDLNELLKQERERLLDVAEMRLVDLIDKGDFNAVKLALTTLGANRGFIEKKANLNLNINRSDSAQSMQEIYQLVGQETKVKKEDNNSTGNEGNKKEDNSDDKIKEEEQTEYT